ncbi:HAD family hydrolase [Synechocystis sp. PCC 7509]|uniref:HAD family hydrolase n=1 Tax=Synechocystis sp. PCC 7509 TaxID=927677 RepID=UPI0002AC3D1F|nr:HAD family hydrolase [Synechocystis sp. PCC 7509]
MKADISSILALDFDGVLCDGLREYFETAWRTYCQIWCPNNPTPSEEVAASFYRLRPVIETGWEMPILVKALIDGVSELEILSNWGEIAQAILLEDKLVSANIAFKLDQIRDEWISTDLSSWLSLHQFYPGVVEKMQSLQGSKLPPMIITTKEGRFVSQLLQQQGVEMPAKLIIGKESQRPKHQILKELIAATQAKIWFVEDRLKTLQLVQQQPNLASVKLYLADWGYNTASEREHARHTPGIELISLTAFTQNNFPTC